MYDTDTPKWFFEVRYGNNCMVGGHFYTDEEMYDWFNKMLKWYVGKDKMYNLRIFKNDEYDKESGINE